MDACKSFIVFVLSVLLVSCTADTDYTTESREDVSWGIQVMPKNIVGDTVDGVVISSIRILIADYKHDGLIVHNGFLSDQSLETTPEGSYRLKLQRGEYKICILANEPAHMTSALNSCTKIKDLNSVKLRTSTNKHNMVFYREQDFTVRPNPTNPETCIIAVDGKDLAGTQMKLVLDKLATKISLHVTKQTIDPKDRFDILNVQVLNVPQHSFLIPDCQFKDVHVTIDPSIQETSFIANGEKKTILAELFLPEYILEHETDVTYATLLSITALYKREGSEGLKVNYTFPIVGFDAESYNMFRNYYFDIHATIKHRGNLDYTPSIGVEVAKWDIASSGEIDLGGNVFTHSQTWEEGTIQGNALNEVRVANNSKATLNFTLSFPKGAIWTAHLTNNLDFEFDLTNGGVREGIATEGAVRQIQVKPLRAVSTNDVYTELYITVFNGQQSVEIDLNDLDHSPVDGKRFIIRQIPN
ncbi:MAG: hypothetical protein ACRCS7_15550 [Tannerellaceae bacterium]